MIEQQLADMLEEQSGDEGLLNEVIEGEEGKQKTTKTAVNARLKEIQENAAFEDERETLLACAELLKKQDATKAKRKASEEALHAKLDGKYPKLTEKEVQALVVEDKWLARLRRGVEAELDHVSHRLTNRIRLLAERYATPLPSLTKEVAGLAARVEEHLAKMGATWN